ncbi:protein PALS2 isoform X2 [Bacillus rossius redtenbacheri]|uniref:protein PALS2 isoform X2 n=1 Tax=Bacillus rossius redtenbacheri TaxID=93214 RepID=UPI002FDE02A2
MVLFNRKERADRRELLASMDQMVLEKPVDNAAFQHVRENIEALNGRAGAHDTDLIFLKGLMDSPIMRSLVKVQDRLEDSVVSAQPLATGNLDLVDEVSGACQQARSKDAHELASLLRSPHVKALLESHDTIAEKSYESEPSNTDAQCQVFDVPVNGMAADAIRMVGLRKSPNEPLGLTVQVDESGNLMIARILKGGMIDRQGLLHVGDVILEVNNVSVSTPEDLQVEIAKAKESVTLKIGPSFEENRSQLETGLCYMRALFDYDPAEDSLLPCKDIGLPFKKGDVLQIMNQKDPNWWQASKVGLNGPAGLIPSLELEERRKAFVKPEADYVHKISICGTRISKKKRKTIYRTRENLEFDKAELLLYEEVTRMPPFKRRTLVLIGSQGVGRRTLKNRIINSDTERFGGVIPFTSRPPRVLEENGRGYWFTDVETMKEEIRQSKFLESGEHNGHLYGTKLDSIREVIRQGKMCVLDCSPAFDRASSIRYSSRRARTLESLASLYEDEDLRETLEESACLQRTFDKYIDLVITNEDFDVTFRKVIEALENLSTEHQWVPVNWVY